MPWYLARLTDEFHDFRIAELRALLRIHGAQELETRPTWPDSPSDSCLIYFKAASDDVVQRMAEHCVVSKAFFQVFGSVRNDDIDTLAKSLDLDALAPYVTPESTFKGDIISWGSKRTAKEKRTLISRFLAHGGKALWKGTVQMKNPDHTFMLVERCEGAGGGVRSAVNPVVETHACRLVAMCTGNVVRAQLDVKKRPYIGTTTMETTMSVIMATVALARPGTLVCDPFVGTGSMLYACAVRGSAVVGSEMDIRVLRGASRRDKPFASIQTNVDYYGIGSLYGGVSAQDFSITCWRGAPIFDAIVTDPPYGNREGIKRVGIRRTDRQVAKVVPDNIDELVHYPSKLQYPMEDMVHDLLLFAARRLVVGGRLVFWLPIPQTFDADQFDEFLQLDHPCLRLVDACLQVFAQWSRRLYVFTKHCAWEEGKHSKDALGWMTVADLPPEHPHCRLFGDTKRMNQELARKPKRGSGSGSGGSSGSDD